MPNLFKIPRTLPFLHSFSLRRLEKIARDGNRQQNNILIEINVKIECKRYIIYKAILYLQTMLLKIIFLTRSVYIVVIAGELFLKLYLVVLVSGKLALGGWLGKLETFLEIL